MKKRNVFLASTLAASLLLAACNTSDEEVKEETVEEERAIEDTIEDAEPVREEETEEVTEPEDQNVNDPADEQTPVTSEAAQSETTEGVVTDSVTDAQTSDSASQTESDSQASAAPQTVVDVSKKKANEVVLYKGDENAEKVVPTQTVSYTYKTNGPITKYIVDQLGYSQYYNKHSVSADERVIMIDFNDSILSSQLIQGSAGGLMFQNSIIASIFENIPKAQVVKLRVNGQEQDADHVSFSGEITRAQFEANQ